VDFSDNEPIIIAENVQKWYDNAFHVLRGANLTVNRQEVVVIMGSSGSGKSTFIRTFNGLKSYQKGRILIDGITVSHNLKNIEAIRQKVFPSPESDHSNYRYSTTERPSPYRSNTVYLPAIALLLSA
jgi:ABC-type multidrug transport system ATPase subunit